MDPKPDECADEGREGPFYGLTPEEAGWNPEEIFNEYKAQYGDLLLGYKVIAEGGPKEGPCGTAETEWTDALGCCLNPPAVYWVEAPGDLAWNKTYVYEVTGGTPPFTWEVEGNGLSVIGQGNKGRVTVNNCFCQPGKVIRNRTGPDQ